MRKQLGKMVHQGSGRSALQLGRKLFWPVLPVPKGGVRSAEHLVRGPIKGRMERKLCMMLPRLERGGCCVCQLPLCRKEGADGGGSVRSTASAIEYLRGILSLSLGGDRAC